MSFNRATGLNLFFNQVFGWTVKKFIVFDLIFFYLWFNLCFLLQRRETKKTQDSEWSDLQSSTGLQPRNQRFPPTTWGPAARWYQSTNLAKFVSHARSLTPVLQTIPRSSAGQRLATLAFRKVWLRTIEWLRFWPPTRSKTRLTFTKPRTPLTGGCVSTAIISLKRRASWSCWMCGARSANKQKKTRSFLFRRIKTKKKAASRGMLFFMFKKISPVKTRHRAQTLSKHRATARLVLCRPDQAPTQSASISLKRSLPRKFSCQPAANCSKWTSNRRRCPNTACLGGKLAARRCLSAARREAVVPNKSKSLRFRVASWQAVGHPLWVFPNKKPDRHKSDTSEHKKNANTFCFYDGCVLFVYLCVWIEHAT